MFCESLPRFRGYPVKCRHVEVAGRGYHLLGPANYEALLDEPRVIARFEQDEYLPYWAEFWPAALLLAETVAGWGPADNSKPFTVLDLGCGLGIAALVALGLGYAVIAADYDEDALGFVVESARANGLPPPQTRSVDWRRSYPDLRAERIVAAEVLYEARHIEPIAAFVAQHLTPNGFAAIADANRPTADGLPETARRHGLAVEVQAVNRPAVGRLFHLSRAAGQTGTGR